MCALDEFSEYLLENRVPTSADFNTYPIRIFIYIFRCTVTTKLEPDGKVITASANADVTIVVNAPQITDHSPNQIVFAGNDVFLFCKAQGIPKPEIFWSEPKYVSNSASKLQGNDFVIRNAILSDNGQYNCTAINSVGNTT